MIILQNFDLLTGGRFLVEEHNGHSGLPKVNFWAVAEAVAVDGKTSATVAVAEAVAVGFYKQASHVGYQFTKKFGMHSKFNIIFNGFSIPQTKLFKK